jgi:ubiquinone/menaquinone biosynthesis C-methylase UbiE
MSEISVGSQGGRERWKQQAGSFGRVAADYDAARPSYPAEAVGWLAGPPPQDVVDVGAGTGKFTELLVGAGHRVTAVDPADAMLGRLSVRLPMVTTTLGTAESVPLPDACADVITFAQAWHWVDQERGPVESGRLLRPGGRLALVWNERDQSVDWVRKVWEPLEKHGQTGTAVLPEGWEAGITGHGPFEDAQHTVFSYHQLVDRAHVLQLLTSRSAIAVMDDNTRSQTLAEVARIIDTHPDTRDREQWILPYETRCYRWTRTG